MRREKTWRLKIAEGKSVTVKQLFGLNVFATFLLSQYLSWPTRLPHLPRLQLNITNFVPEISRSLFELEVQSSYRSFTSTNTISTVISLSNHPQINGTNT